MVDLTNSSTVWYGTVCAVLLGGMATETVLCTSASVRGPWSTAQYTSDVGDTMEATSK